MAAHDAARPCLKIAVAAPVAELFDYLPPADSDDPVPLGSRVLVPFGRGRRIGIAVAAIDRSEQAPERLKSIETVLDPRPLLTAEDLAFLLWAADYYHCPPGEALFSALPARLRRPEPQVDARRTGWRATPAGHALALDTLSRAPRQAELMALLQGQPAGLDQDSIRARLGGVAETLRRMAGKGLIEPCLFDADDGNPCRTRTTPRPPAPALTGEQHAAVEAIGATAGFACFLLDGVTGSGKTEVYLRLIARTLAAGRQVLVLVPEIGLTPQLAERVARRIDAPLVVLHSGLSDREREVGWQQAAVGRAPILLGTRSAVFTPLPALGLVIVDEEHDLSLKQQDGFRYSARDLAIRRAQLVDCPVVLGSATPSMETLRNAQLGRYKHLLMTRRAGGAEPPRIQLVDIRGQYLETGLGHRLLTRIGEEIETGNQVLLFLNRRGFSPVLTCHDCGWISECRRCDARMTLHRDRGQLVCHHCGLLLPLPVQCPYCTSPDLRPLGQGTERVEDTLRQRFPGIPLARIDRDSTRRQGELERLLSAAKRGEYPLLLGTQMLAKGHHLPGITLVGIMDVDHGLYGSDFRAAERMAQLLVQVAGRAGRAERAGTVLVQTRHPGHPLLVRLLRDGYGAFAEAALAERAEAGVPPFSYQTLLRADSPREQAAMEFLHQALAAARPLAGSSVQLWGPAPSGMERRAGRIRAQLLLQAPTRGALQALLRALLPQLRSLKAPRHLRWSIDVDPQESL
jgi:primosomal protein N' (replication factor Y)